MKIEVLNRSIYVIFRSFFILPMLFLLPACANEEPSNQYSGALKPYLSCKFDDGLSIVTIDKRRSQSGQRSISTDKGKESVSVIDGFRLGLAYPDCSYLFVNLKIEQSDPDLFENDKRVILAKLESFKDSQMLKLELNGYHVYGVENSEIDKGGVIGIYTFFLEDDHIVVTAYLLNQEKENRRFNNITEFRQLRTNFLRGYTECIKLNKAQ